jgi:hypothetical protein
MNKQTTQVTAVEQKFFDVKIPEFKKIIGEKYVMLGKDDKWADFLLYLYKKSAKHRAIINGKVKYIFGSGLSYDGSDPKIDDFIKSYPCKKIITDTETFGGYYLQIIPTIFTGTFSIYHIPFAKIRKSRDGSTFYFKEDWSKKWEDYEAVFPAFKPNIKEASIFEYKEYNPEDVPYALPGYTAACNDIESDVEISKAILTNAKGGFSTTKLVSFFSGEPAENQKRLITERFENYATGAEGKKVLIQYLNDPLKKTQIDNLGESDLTKENFTPTYDLITTNIFTSHEVTHPPLFGIQQAGKLGSSQELRTGYEIFKNTYANNKQEQFDQVVNYFANLKGILTPLFLTDVNPVGIDIDATMITEALSKEEIRELLGYKGEQLNIGNQAVSMAINSLSPLVANKVLEKMTPDEVRSLAGLLPTLGGGTIETNASLIPTMPTAETMVNEHLKNLTGRQSQQIDRIIRKFNSGNYTREQAKAMMSAGFGLTEEQINTMLGANNFSEEKASDEFLSALFATHGEDRAGYDVRHSKPATFTDEDEQYPLTFWEEVKEWFKDEPKTDGNGSGAGAGDRGAISKANKLIVRYSYEKREDVGGSELIPTSRPFCKFMVNQNKFYSRANINAISALLGYNVFNQVGGFWNDNGVIKAHCRHIWKANVVTRI